MKRSHAHSPSQDRAGVPIQDQRAAERYSAEVAMRVSTVRPASGVRGPTYYAVLASRSIDVSEDGIALHTEVPLAPGDRVLVEAWAAADTPCERLGWVVWRGPRQGMSDGNVIGIELDPTEDRELQQQWAMVQASGTQADN